MVTRANVEAGNLRVVGVGHLAEVPRARTRRRQALAAPAALGASAILAACG